MKIFRDLEYDEQMGTGIIRILQKYDKNCFEFFPNNIRVSFPFNKNKFKDKENNNQLSMQDSILLLVEENPKITIDALSSILGITKRTVQRNINELKNQNIISRTGAKKDGYWIINK